MTAITKHLPARIPQLRQLNIVRDLPGVADLVENCFIDTMDDDGRNYIQQMRRAGRDNVFLRWASSAIETASMPLSGYVWEENGEIIGNVSLIPYHHARKKFYLIANVAVRLEYRKRGIGRALTEAAMQHANQQHADETWLHVRDDNQGAIHLYRSIGFVDIARRTTWQTQPDQEASNGTRGVTITKRIARDWPTQETWLKRAYPDVLTWYQPLPWKSLRPGFSSALYRFISDYDVRHWVARTGDSPSAVVSWQAMSARTNRLWVAIPTEDNGSILTALLLYVRRKLVLRGKISLDFPAGLYETAFEAAGFHPYRTLLWMKSDETSACENRKSS
jgi:GNAT superfamily N-acetyltransferase